MEKREEFIGLRIDKKSKNFLEKKAKEEGISLSNLILKKVLDAFKERSLWDELEKYLQPIEKPILESQPYIELQLEIKKSVLQSKGFKQVEYLSRIEILLNAIINKIHLIPEEQKKLAAICLSEMSRIIDNGFSNLKSENREINQHIIKERKNLADTICYNLTTSAFAKKSYYLIKEELEKVFRELISELDKNLKGGEK